jgi:hypothetical protein
MRPLFRRNPMPQSERPMVEKANHWAVPLSMPLA